METRKSTSKLSAFIDAKNGLTLIQIGWIFAVWHLGLAYLLSSATDVSDALTPPGPLRDMVWNMEPIRWLSLHSIDRDVLTNQCTFAFLLSPLALCSWHFFARDAVPRRPVPKAWHSIPPAILFVGIAMTFAHKSNRGDEVIHFRSGLLNFLFSSNLGAEFFFVTTAWLAAGFLYFACLPIAELLGYSKESRKKA